MIIGDRNNDFQNQRVVNKEDEERSKGGEQRIRKEGGREMGGVQGGREWSVERCVAIGTSEGLFENWDNLLSDFRVPSVRWSRREDGRQRRCRGGWRSSRAE
jgi:hypothetical protein